MSHSILAHLSFNFYRSCLDYRPDYRHAQFRSSARLFMARISPDHRSEFRPNVRAKEMSCSFLAHLSFIFIAPIRLIIVMLSIAHQRGFSWPKSRPHVAQNFCTGATIWSLIPTRNNKFFLFVTNRLTFMR